MAAGLAAPPPPPPPPRLSSGAKFLDERFYPSKPTPKTEPVFKTPVIQMTPSDGLVLPGFTEAVATLASTPGISYKELGKRLKKAFPRAKVAPGSTGKTAQSIKAKEKAMSGPVFTP
jgi:hypothetical protein